MISLCERECDIYIYISFISWLWARMCAWCRDWSAAQVQRATRWTGFLKIQHTFNVTYSLVLPLSLSLFLRLIQLTRALSMRSKRAAAMTTTTIGRTVQRDATHIYCAAVSSIWKAVRRWTLTLRVFFCLIFCFCLFLFIFVYFCFCWMRLFENSNVLILVFLKKYNNNFQRFARFFVSFSFKIAAATMRTRCRAACSVVWRSRWLWSPLQVLLSSFLANRFVICVL